VKVTMEGHTLKITADGGYEQSIVLANAAAVAHPDVQRRDQTLVINIPRGDQPFTSAPKNTTAPGLSTPDRFDQDMLTRMEDMRREMDRVFEDAFKSFRLGVGGVTYFDQSQFGSSVDLQDEKDRYIVRACLPGRNVQKIDVKIQDQTLTISAKAEQREKKQGDASNAESFAMSSYAQTLTLPGPVKADKMEVERKEGLLVITLPKTGV